MTRHLKMATDKKSSGCLSCWLEWEKPGRKAAELLKQGKNVIKTQPGEGVCALSAFFSSDFKVPLLPKGALASWSERARGARLALKIKQILQQSLRWGKVIAGCPAGTDAKCPVPSRWHGLICFEYCSSKFLNSGNPPNPHLELLVGIWGPGHPLWGSTALTQCTKPKERGRLCVQRGISKPDMDQHKSFCRHLNENKLLSWWI